MLQSPGKILCSMKSRQALDASTVFAFVCCRRRRVSLDAASAQWGGRGGYACPLEEARAAGGKEGRVAEPGGGSGLKSWRCAGREGVGQGRRWFTWTSAHLIVCRLRGAIWLLWCLAMQLVQQRAHPADDHVMGGALQGLQLAVVAHMAGHFMGHDHTCCTHPSAEMLANHASKAACDMILLAQRQACLELWNSTHFAALLGLAPSAVAGACCAAKADESVPSAVVADDGCSVRPVRSCCAFVMNFANAASPDPLR